MNLASIYLWLGWAPSAIELNLRYAELRPNSFHIAVDTAHALTVWGGDIVRGRTYVDRARQLATNLTENPGPWASAFVDFFAAHEAWCRGDSAKAANEIERFAKMLPDPSGGRDSFYAIYAGLLYLALGKTQAAQEVFQKLRPEVERSTMLAVVALANDDSRLLRFHMAEFLRKNKSPYPNGLRIWLMIRAGMLEEAEQFVARRRSDHTSELYVPLLEGELHLARGQKAAAIERLEEAFRTTRQTGTPIFFLGAESLAKALDEGGRADEALHVLESASHQRVRAYVRPRPSGYFWLRIEVALAKLYRKLGKIEQAQTTENKLRRTLSEADMEHPILTKLP
jgi:tetratricopeptide (TPR) repeat protein